MKKTLIATAVLAVALGGLTSLARAADPFVLSSTTFKDGERIPVKAAGPVSRGGNCVGENISPALSWSGVPDGTKSFAITMIDPEGRGGTGVHHFIAYGIAPSVKGFAEGELSKASDKFVGGKSSMDVGFYTGPCAPPGAPHHYTFMLIATDFEPKELAPGLTIPELWAKLPGRTKGATGLVGLFSKP